MSVKSSKQYIQSIKGKKSKSKTEFEYSSVYTLLVAVVLSAQSTDKGVNSVTRSFLKKLIPQKWLNWVKRR